MPFYLLSDEDEKVHELFGVIKPKKILLGMERSTFIFNKSGELVKEFRKVKVKGHGEEVLEAVKNIN